MSSLTGILQEENGERLHKSVLK